jgi:hypothetical protein
MALLLIPPLYFLLFRTLIGIFVIQMIPDNPFRKAAFERVVDSVRTGALAPSANGVVDLSESLRGLTKDGKVYVTEDGNEMVAVCFLAAYL